MPLVIDSDNVVYFDVDGTLVLWDYPAERAAETIAVGAPGLERRVLPHWTHVEEIKKYKARGHRVVVWSAGGHEWAESVVRKLGLIPFVDIIIRKPTWYYDDWKSEVFMGDPIFLENK